MNKLLLAFCLFIGFGTFCSCSSDDEETNNPDMIWDLAPINLKITPVDQQGNYILLDFDDVKVTAEWRGYVYEKDSNASDFPAPPTRAYLAKMYGLLSYDTCLVFGELDRELDYYIYNHMELVIIYYVSVCYIDFVKRITYHQKKIMSH